MTQPVIALAFPLHSGDRDALRARCPDLPAFPSIVPNSEAQPCASCGMTLAVGPLTLISVRRGVPLYCPLCAVEVAARFDSKPQVVNLGNPDSRPE